MSLPSIEHEILSLATEDYQGLWEIRSQIEQLSSSSGSDVREVVATAAWRLLERGWIAIFEGSLRDGRIAALPRKKAKETLQSAAAWDLPPEGSSDLMIAATDAGERAYFSGAVAGAPVR